MAKKKTLRVVNEAEQAEQAEQAEKTDTATLFDAESYKAELAALRERHLGGLREAIALAKKQYDDAELALFTLNAQLDKILGKTTKVAASGSSGNAGKRTRITKEQLAELEGQALAFIMSGGKEGVSRGAVAEHLGLEPNKAATVLTALKEAKKAETKGEKAASRWFPT